MKLKRIRTKYIFYCIIPLILIFGIFWVNRFISRLSTPDLKYNTRYSETYKENKFQSLTKGDKKSEMIKLLGEPIEIYKSKFEHSIIYSKNNVSIEPGSLGVENHDTIYPIRFCRFNFKENGDVLSTFNRQNFIDSTYLKKLEKLNYNEIIEKIGEPLQEYKCDCNCEVYNYSRLKEGAYSGKNPTIKIKRIALDDRNKIKFKIDKIGNPYNKQIGICKI